MTREHFNSEINRLKEVYGEKPYPVERMNLLWDSFRDLEPNLFSEMISEAIATRRTAPLAKELTELAIALKPVSKHTRIPNPGNILAIFDRAGQNTEHTGLYKHCREILEKRLDGKLTSEQWEAELALIDAAVAKKSPCKQCHGIGYVFAVNKKNAARTQFICPCPYGDRMPRELQSPDKTIVQMHLWDANTFPEYELKVIDV